MSKDTRLHHIVVSSPFISPFVAPFWKTFLRILEYFGFFSFLFSFPYNRAYLQFGLWRYYIVIFLKKTSQYIWALKIRRFGEWKTRIKLNKVFHMKIKTSYLSKIWYDMIQYLILLNRFNHLKLKLKKVKCCLTSEVTKDKTSTTKNCLYVKF